MKFPQEVSSCDWYPRRGLIIASNRVGVNESNIFEMLRDVILHSIGDLSFYKCSPTDLFTLAAKISWELKPPSLSGFLSNIEFGRNDGVDGDVLSDSSADLRLYEGHLMIIVFSALIISGIRCDLRRVFSAPLVALAIIVMMACNDRRISSPGCGLFLGAAIFLLPDALRGLESTLLFVLRNLIQPGCQYISTVSKSYYFAGVFYISLIAGAVIYDAPWACIPIAVFLFRTSLLMVPPAGMLLLDFIWLSRESFELFLFSILPAFILKSTVVASEPSSYHLSSILDILGVERKDRALSEVNFLVFLLQIALFECLRRYSRGSSVKSMGTKLSLQNNRYTSKFRRQTRCDNQLKVRMFLSLPYILNCSFSHL